MGQHLDVEMEWSDGAKEQGRATYISSGVTRDCYGFGDKYALKLTPAAKA